MQNIIFKIGHIKVYLKCLENIKICFKLRYGMIFDKSGMAYFTRPSGPHLKMFFLECMISKCLVVPIPCK